MRILFCSDCHLKNFNFKRRYHGISERTLDLLDRLETIANYAIKNECKLLVFAGDFYEQSGYTPDSWIGKPVHANIKKMFRRRILIPLLKEKIRILMIGGNHDSHPKLNYGCDIEELNIANSVTVKRNLDIKKYTINKEKIGFILLPYIRPMAIFDNYINSDGSLDPRDVTISPQLAAEYVSEVFIPDALRKLGKMDRKIVVGHYHFVGTRIKNLPPSFALREMEFNRAMIREPEIDLAVFGHIHQHQTVGKKIIVPGSIERMNFGERDDRKYFIDYDTETNEWKAIELECRPMVQIDVDVSAEGARPTEEILSAIKEVDVKDAMVKLVIKSSSSNIRKMDNAKIRATLEPAFHYFFDNIPFKKDDGKLVDLSRVDFNPESLLVNFIKMQYTGKDGEYVKKLIERNLKWMED